MSLEERVVAVEKQLAEIRDLKGIPGREGRPGNIQAALNNVEAAAPGLVKEALKSLGVIDEHGDLKGKAGDPGRDGRNGVDGRTPTKEEIDTAVYRMLHEVGLLTDGSVGYQLLNAVQVAVLAEVQKEGVRG